MKNIFISYSRDNQKYVEEEIIPSIETIQGVKEHCWFDVNDIESGAEFEQKIIDGIKECQIFLLMLTKSSQVKPWPYKELKIAEEQLEGDSLRHVILENLDNSEFVEPYKKYQEKKDIIFWEVSRQQQKLKNDIEKWIALIAGRYYNEALKLEEAYKNGEDANDFLNLLEKSAELEFSPAQSKLAFYYKQSHNLEEAVRWCERAIKNDNASAFSLLGNIYKEKGDIGNTIANFQESANHNWAYGQYKLGKIYNDGMYLKKDTISAIYWLKKSADQNHPDAQKLIGDILVKDFKDHHELAIDYYQKAKKNFTSLLEVSRDEKQINHAQNQISKINKALEKLRSRQRTKRE